MKELRAVHRGCGKWALMWVVGLATALGLGAPALAQVPALQTRSPERAYGIVGLAKSQVAYLNLVLTDPPITTHPGCMVTMSFVNANSQVFLDAAGRPVKRTVRLKPQIADRLVLNATDILKEGQLRERIRAVLSPVPNDTTSDCKSLVTSLELAGSDGKTAVMINDPPPPWPINPPVGF